MIATDVVGQYYSSSGNGLMNAYCPLVLKIKQRAADYGRTKYLLMFAGNENDDSKKYEHIPFGPLHEGCVKDSELGDFTAADVKAKTGDERLTTNISPYKVTPITDQDKIDQLFSKNSDSGCFFVTVACKEKAKLKSMLAPYCSPTMYYVCYKCGMASQEGRTVETHIKTCVNAYTNKIKIKIDRVFSKTEPRFGWYSGERYLVIEECPYAFSCVCGAAFDRVRNLQTHFKKCPYTENIFPMVGSSCVNLDGIVPKRSVNDTEHHIKSDSNRCGFDGRGTSNLKFCCNIPSKSVLTGQCTKTNEEKKRYKIINRCRDIDRIINKYWDEIVLLVDLKSDTNVYSEEERNQWGARSIQCDRKEIGVTSEQVTDNGGTVMKIRGNECWSKIEKKYNIKKTWMNEIVNFAKSIAQADTTKGGFMSFDSFSLILTKSSETQQEHIDLLYPLSQFALTISNNVDTTIAYRLGKCINEVNSMVSLGALLQSQVNVCDKTDKFKELIKKIINIDKNSLAGKMIEDDGYGQLFQMRIKIKDSTSNKNTKFERAYIKHAPTGTYTRISGGVVHSGSGVAGRRVRCILFWSGKPIGDNEMYDPDVQQTMFSVMIEVIREVWINNRVDLDLRKEMVQLMYHVYQLCGSKYRKYGQTYPHLPNIEIMITKFGTSKSNKNWETMIKDVAKLDLFAGG